MPIMVRSFADIRTEIKNGITYYCMTDISNLSHYNRPFPKPVKIPCCSSWINKSRVGISYTKHIQQIYDEPVVFKDIEKPTQRGKNAIYVVIELATLYAGYLSSEFAAKMATWVESWRAIDKKHHAEYTDAISTIVNDASPEQPEADVRDALSASISDSKTEVDCDAGRIDILSSIEIVEVKHVKNAMHAIGQILCYRESYPTHTMRIHLFGGRDVSRSFTAVCINQKITVTFAIQ
jgi:hypothetical protein